MLRQSSRLLLLRSATAATSNSASVGAVGVTKARHFGGESTKVLPASEVKERPPDRLRRMHDEEEKEIALRWMYNEQHSFPLTRSLAGDSDADQLKKFIEKINSGTEDSGSSFVLNPSSDKIHRTVIIRLRPLSNSEISQQGYGRCVRQESHQTVTWTGHPETRFTFDLVADQSVSQEKLFNVAGVPMVENCVSG